MERRADNERLPEHEDKKSTGRRSVTWKQLKSDKTQLTVRRPAAWHTQDARPLDHRIPRNLEEAFEQADGALFPGHAVGDTRGVLELLPVIQIPSEVPQQSLLVRELGRVA